MSTQSSKPNKKEHFVDVQPIRSHEQIEDMKWALKRHCSERDYILFILGINTGLRVTDLLNLKIEQITQLKERQRKEFPVQESKHKNRKNKKPRIVNITSIFETVYQYALTVDSEWLFPSRKGDKAITKTQAYRALNKAAEYAGVESVGTHTMRKTFSYWLYKNTNNIAMVQELLNHSHPSITLRYIGISKEEKDNVLDQFCL